jgi:glycogen(starch) synthase
MTKVLSLCVESDRIMGGRGECVLQINARLRSVHQICADLTWEQNPTWAVTVPPQSEFYNFEHKFPADFLLGCEAFTYHALELCKTWKPDVVHAHDWDMMGIARNVRRLTGIPFVAHFHLFQHEMLIAQGRPHNKETLLPPSYEWQGLEYADRVICVSESMRRYAQEKMMISRPIDVVHNGVTMPANIKEWNPGEISRLLYMGRIDPQKGWEYVARLPVIASDVEATIAGRIAAIEHEQAEQTEDMKLIRRLEKMPRFRYLGHVSRSRRDAVYREADFVVMPSRQEPFGIVALEALARGIPLITSGVDGLSEFVGESNAWICEHSEESILECVREARKFPEETRKRIGKGLETARCFSWDETARKCEAILNEAANGNTGTGRTATHTS